VHDQLFVHFGASAVIADRLRLALNVPLALLSQGDSVAYLDTTLAAQSGVALGDIRLAADLRLFGISGGPITMALGLQVYVPSGSRESFTGDGKVRLVPRLAIAGNVSLFAYSLRVGLDYRTQDALLTDVATGGAGLTFAATAGLSLAKHLVLVGPELWGSTIVAHGAAFQKETTPFEILFGVHVRPKNFRVGVAAGPGLTRGIGSPAVRVVGMFEWCPSVPEDRDQDGILDDDDACPDVPGVASADPRKNGCPPDRDRDGIIDRDDACPDIPGIESDDPRKNGCPSDRDNDHIFDRDDACPDEPGVATDDPNTNGCPPDSDGDSILDPKDACPTVPGPPDPDPKKNGCPKARIEKDQIVITERVEFETDSAKLLGSSNGILIAVLNVLNEHPEITKLLVEGHTDHVGGPAYNKQLSERRAKSVVKWLVEHGVPQPRLLDAGFGLSRPLDTNHTAAGRQRNRRVEFHIVETGRPAAANSPAPAPAPANDIEE
jgi:outer membrane protein OmpA-like peptidoglycan-associated protein